MDRRRFLIGAKFWEADAKHADEAVHLIGRVQG